MAQRMRWLAPESVEVEAVKETPMRRVTRTATASASYPMRSMCSAMVAAAWLHCYMCRGHCHRCHWPICRKCRRDFCLDCLSTDWTPWYPSHLMRIASIVASMGFPVAVCPVAVELLSLDAVQSMDPEKILKKVAVSSKRNNIYMVHGCHRTNDAYLSYFRWFGFWLRC